MSKLSPREALRSTWHSAQGHRRAHPLRQRRWSWGGALVLGRPTPSSPQAPLLPHFCLQLLLKTGLNVSQPHWSTLGPFREPLGAVRQKLQEAGGRGSPGQRGFLSPAASQGTDRYSRQPFRTDWLRALPTGCTLFGHSLSEHQPDYLYVSPWGGGRRASWDRNKTLGESSGQVVAGGTFCLLPVDWSW